MYFVDEDGREKPTAEALEELSTIVMFRSGVWFMAIGDMFFKVRTSALCIYVILHNTLLGV
jgi:hypothetical protein